MMNFVETLKIFVLFTEVHLDVEILYIVDSRC